MKEGDHNIPRKLIEEAPPNGRRRQGIDHAVDGEASLRPPDTPSSQLEKPVAGGQERTVFVGPEKKKKNLSSFYKSSSQLKP